MKILIFSGAGLDAESGIPTFRDANGLWENFSVEDVCYLENFQKNYNLVHSFYNKMRKSLKDVEPNSAHHKIKELSDKYTVLNYTANVSDLLERAGCTDVKHIHGELTKVHLDYPKGGVVDIGYTDHKVSETGYDKPAVVFFGEHAPLYEPFFYDLDDLTEEDIVIVVGTTLEINPIHYTVAASGAKFILINPESNPEEGSQLAQAINLCDVYINKTATEGFSEIDKHIENFIAQGK